MKKGKEPENPSSQWDQGKGPKNPRDWNPRIQVGESFELFWEQAPKAWQTEWVGTQESLRPICENERRCGSYASKQNGKRTRRPQNDFPITNVCSPASLPCDAILAKPGRGLPYAKGAGTRSILTTSSGTKSEKDESEDEDEKKMICQVGTEKWVKIRKGEVTVDSAAEESVCPVGWCEEYELQPKVGRALRFVTANGAEMKHYGSRKPKFQPKAGSTKDQTVEIEFQVCDVTKPLVAVRRLEEMGNKVHFGPKAEDNYIEKSTGEWIQMRKKNGSYVIDVDFVVRENDVAQVFQRQAK